MIREIIIFVFQVISIVALYVIIDYKRPYNDTLINWTAKEKTITFFVVLIALTILKIK